MPVSSAAIAAVRRFNRFYTRRIGVLRATLLESGFSITEVRVLREIRELRRPDASTIAQSLDLDPGYLSRMLQRFVRARLVLRTPGNDRRRSHLHLTPAGRSIIARLDRLADAEIQGLLAPLSPGQRSELLGALATVERLLDPSAPPTAPLILRDPRPGDLGWLVHRHGVLYASEYGWDQRFEGLVAEVVASFAKQHDPKRERCWIADQAGRIQGCVMLVRHPTRQDTARLRILLVEPSARGLGLGRRLVAECIRFAKRAGYRTITLWTNSVLRAARHLYEEAGFELVEERPHAEFGRGLIGQTWVHRIHR
ncbi:MAG TPA: bifunctional helix-turn-helix transcriptional regulator/GNAT family N-acetyltransferase [Gemmatimonadales bacterium]|nr:bifunctional helix-turn-helix transcriptional regulator/GNAT family N-acetyltransferase [Gemmatimonadales bacterium]